MKMNRSFSGFVSISPMLFFLALFLGVGFALGDFSKIPLIVVFLLSSFYAVLTLRGVSVEERIRCFSQGAGSPNMLLMVWIFVLAGAFAQSAKDLGSIDAVVNLTLSFLPPEWLLAGLFLSACLVSLSIGTSVGTIVALVPVAAGLASKTGIDTPLLVASVVGGAFFGDNLSFISDTTVAATRTQGCKSMKDKFKANILIALPAAVVTFFLYVFLSNGLSAESQGGTADAVKVLPYLFVLLVAILGVNELLVLAMGILLTMFVGVVFYGMSVLSFFGSVATGVLSMSELIIISMLAGGMLEVVRLNHGIDYMLRGISRFVRGKRSAEYSIALLVSLTNLCTANNTVAILSVGDLVKQIADKYHIDNRMSASLLDIFSCVVQGLLPYGAQLLMAAGLAAVSPVSIIPYLYYPMILGGAALLAIALRYPRRYY